MHRLRELVRLHRMGLSTRKLAIALKIGRNTLRAYFVKLDAARLLEGPLDSIPDLYTLKCAIRRPIARLESFEGRTRPSSAFSDAPPGIVNGPSFYPGSENAANIAIETFAFQYGLSPKETMLLELAVAGKNNDEAAEVLGCSRPTVGTYWHRIFNKRGLRSQRDVIASILRVKFDAVTLNWPPFDEPSVALDPNGSDFVIKRTT